MSPARPPVPKITAFDLPPGRVIGGKYVVERKVGSGWEGEVYEVTERRTGILRAAKLFYPQRNVRDRAVKIHAKKLDALRTCSLVVQYHSSETVRFRGTTATCLISEYVDGVVLPEFIRRQPGSRLHPFEALHLLYALTKGIEEIHAARQYHGDLHEENIMVKRRGIQFLVKVIDFFHYGPPTAALMREDVYDLARVLYESVGGKAHYASQPPEVKAICKGLRRDLIRKSFPTARHLRKHLETFAWQRPRTGRLS